ncbi:aminopeptidase N [Cohaesibacter sp. ES.047]|uniref:aminopeptidase N n=1 Tax=Cohaesibacter sp. ES.047 TaxID=1798205 RepID=UPI000BB92695|nr:aminopeptidase N [Cohaesibacter sp. ES.047]SNY92830.1 aminopeptidase N [Cohaesibacter sp. ES.047]
MQEAKSIVRLEDYQETPYTIDHVSLTFRLEANATLVTACLSIAPRPETLAGTALHLDGEELDLVSTHLDGEPLANSAFETTDRGFCLSSPPAGAFTLQLVTRISPDTNTQLMGLYRSNGTYCTQCEAEGFRRITYFYDRPDVLCRYDVRIEAPVSVPKLLANGNLIEEGPMDTPAGVDSDEAWHYAVWQDPYPKPSYLFAMVAGDLAHVEDRFVTRSGREVTLAIYVEHGKQDRVSYAMDALKRSMRWDEEVFGLEYDLDIFMIVAVSDFNMGAMENKGLNIFNDKYVLAKPDTATDTDYALIEAVIAHEYFHNWTGNRITCRDWFQLCLKEGLTVYRDQEFSSDMRSRPVKRISDVGQLRARQFPEDSGPLAHPVRPTAYSEINNFYTSTVYEKGAELCRMLEVILGQSGFKAGLDLYFQRHDGQAVTIEDFIASFEVATGADLSQFALWYEQAGTPDLVATYAYDPIRKQLSLAIEQSCMSTPGQPNKKVLHIPIRFGLIARDGSAAAFTKVRDAKTGEIIGDGQCDLLELRERQQKFLFEGVTKEAVPSLLRGFSAPVHLRTNLTREDHLCLMQYDDDPYNRWEATQYVLMDHLIRRTYMIRRGDQDAHKDALDKRLLSAIGQTIADESLEHAFRAQIATVPSDADVAREIGKDVDPDAIHAARQGMVKELADSLFDQAIALYGSLENRGAFAVDAASAGRRALRNALLNLIIASDKSVGSKLASKQYHDATNMTDRFAALAALTRNGSELAEEMLEDFHARYRNDALVIDKWLSLQASTAHDGTIERVKQLMEHPSFSISNPNRVRSLIGSFAMNNAIQFNRADGQGFALVADIILTLDAKNPQTAARLANNFRSWRALEAPRQASAEEHLRRIGETPNLSEDVADIVNRCLQ